MSAVVWWHCGILASLAHCCCCLLRCVCPAAGPWLCGAIHLHGYGTHATQQLALQRQNSPPAVPLVPGLCRSGVGSLRRCSHRRHAPAFLALMPLLGWSGDMRSLLSAGCPAAATVCARVGVSICMGGRRLGCIECSFPSSCIKCISGVLASVGFAPPSVRSDFPPEQTIDWLCVPHPSGICVCAGTRCSRLLLLACVLPCLLAAAAPPS